MKDITDEETCGIGEVYEFAKQQAEELEKVTISQLKKRLMVGYNQAAKIFPKLQADGVLEMVD